ncbi:hypothetical protein QAD02_024050 [Eretmocerus hayati]|uniref:Uncharacterized protein n=1 Tax=Eretmocerus hayati TaxID=131215 RepID=A0ACC2PXC6_9HYME|nr:hypothetical protein QAD02_024050 [Eretmocerus hayati]
MFPWMKEQITEAWNTRKNSKSSKRHSNGTNDPKGMQTSSASDTFLINIISLEGTVMNVPATLDSTVEKIKSTAVENIYKHDKNKQPPNFRLVHGTSLKPLENEKHLHEEDISESDELLLVEMRPAVEKENLSEDSLRGPTDEELMNATKDLPVRNPPKPALTPYVRLDFQGEIRKILITLIQASAKLLMYSPDAAKFYEVIRKKLEAQLKPPNDPKAVKYLVDMGFSERKALKALRLRKMNTTEALEWLLEHQDDPDDDDSQLPDLSELLSDDSGSTSAGASQGSRRSSIKETFSKITKKKTGPEKKPPNLLHIVNLLIDNYCQQQKLDFKPDQSIVKSMEEMGFDREKILETLKITGNNKANACAWLLGERRDSLQDLNQGMDLEGPIYDAIMSNPQIQLSLTNPQMLLAYLSMLESPMSAGVWMKDPLVSPVLSQIFRTYHSEKHTIQVNRYDNS